MYLGTSGSDELFVETLDTIEKIFSPKKKSECKAEETLAERISRERDERSKRLDEEFSRIVEERVKQLKEIYLKDSQEAHDVSDKINYLLNKIEGLEKKIDSLSQ